ncbi:MAG: hypothetical protein HY553_03885, partial [Elusimicrobia bacterium]|nr:hypothetical protein [Elusimicrobiota bacterium]
MDSGSTMMTPPTLQDVHDAHRFIGKHLPLPSPLLRSDALATILGLDVRLKLESLL